MIESEIKKHEQLGQMSEKEKEQMKMNLNKNIDDMAMQTGEKDG
jgi:hypothetical protein